MTPDPAIEALFRDYTEGFNDFDAEAVADCFAYPVTIWQDGRGNVFADEAELIENIEALLSVFEREEIVFSAFEITESMVSGDTGFALVSWRQERADGEAALEFTCRYALIRETEGEWLIALAVNE